MSKSYANIFSDVSIDENCRKELKKFISSSFVSTLSVENINGPEDTLHIINRNIFFENPAGKDNKEDDITKVGTEVYDSLDEMAQALLYTFRGRNLDKKIKKRIPFFYSLLYPQHSKIAGLRNSHGMTPYRTLIKGIFAQVWFKGSNKHKADNGDEEINKQISEDLELIYDAFKGKFNRESRDDEIWDPFSDIKINDDTEELISFKDFEARTLKDLKGDNDAARYTYDINFDDDLCTTIYEDFIELCKQEGRISKKSRFRWIQMITALSAISTTSYLMSHAKLIVSFKTLILESILSEKKFSNDDIVEVFRKRSKDLMVASEEPNKNFKEFFVKYQTSLMQIHEILYLLNKCNILDYKKTKLTFNIKDVTAFLEHLSKNSGTFFEKLKNINETKDFDKANFRRKIHIRASEYTQYNDYTFSKTSFGTSLMEYTRQLWKPKNDSKMNESYLIWHKQPKNFVEKKKVNYEHQIIAGPSTTELFIRMTKGKSNGKITLKKLIEHFKIYGITFDQTDQAVMLLKNQIEGLGLLEGSSDAGINLKIKDVK